MIKKILRSKRGEGYIDTCVGMLVFVMMLVVIINIFSFVTLKTEMDEICDELIETATYTGEFGNEFWGCKEKLVHERFYFGVSITADKYFNSTYNQVQLGDRMTITVDASTYVKGLGIFKIPITLKVTKSGLSEQYWKVGG